MQGRSAAWFCPCYTLPCYVQRYLFLALQSLPPYFFLKTKLVVEAYFLPPLVLPAAAPSVDALAASWFSAVTAAVEAAVASSVVAVEVVQLASAVEAAVLFASVAV